MKLLSFLCSGLLILFSHGPHAASVIFTPPTSITLSGGGWPLDPTYTANNVACPGGTYCWHYQLFATACRDQTCNGSGGGLMIWATTRTGLFRPANNLPWTSFLSTVTSLSYTLTPSLFTALQRQPYICYSNPTRTSTTSPTTTRFLGCERTVDIGIPALCTVNLPSVIDFGIVPAGSVLRTSATGQIRCDGAADVSIIATNLSANSSTVVLDSANGITADMDVNGTNGMIGTTFPAASGSNYTFNIGATLRTQPTSSAGNYTGNALVVTTWQ